MVQEGKVLMTKTCTMTLSGRTLLHVHSTQPFRCGLVVLCCSLLAMSFTCSAEETKSDVTGTLASLDTTTTTTTNSSKPGGVGGSGGSQTQTHNKTRQTYLFTFPETYEASPRTMNTLYNQQLTISTPSPGNVTFRVTAFRWGSGDGGDGVKMELGKYVINNNTWRVVSVMSANATALNSTLVTVRVTSTGVLNVYAFSFFTKNVDADLVPPVSVLGKDYSLLTLPFNEETVLSRAFFVATAVEDGTNVTVSKEDAEEEVDLGSFVGGGSVELSSSGSQLTATLGRRQTLSALLRTDLTGVRVKADRPLTVSCGVNRNRFRRSCCLDHMWAHLPGMGAWGREYLTFPTTVLVEEVGVEVEEEGEEVATRDDVYYLAAAEDNTRVHLDCGVEPLLTLSPALRWHRVTMDATTGPHSLSAASPFLAVKAVLGVRGVIDPCMLTLTPTRRWATTLLFPFPDEGLWDEEGYQFRVAVLMEESRCQELRVNGLVPRIQWKRVTSQASNDSSSSSSSAMVTLVGGELNDAELTRLGRDLLVLTSVTGTARMAAYVTGFKDFRGMCFALGGDAPENKDWIPEGTLNRCHEETTTTDTVTTHPTTDTVTTHPTTETTHPTTDTVTTHPTTDTVTTHPTTDTVTTHPTTETTHPTTDTVTTHPTTDTVTTHPTTDTEPATTAATTRATTLEAKDTTVTQSSVESTGMSTASATDTPTTAAEGDTTESPALTTLQSTTVETTTTATTTTSAPNTFASSPEAATRTETESVRSTTTTVTNATADMSAATAPTETVSGSSNSATTSISTKTSASSFSSSSSSSSSSTSPSNSVLSTPQLPVTRTPQCHCVQKCALAAKADRATVAAEVVRIRTELLLSTANLSSHVRRVTSAADNRVSSVTMGVLSIVVISFVALFLVAFDVLRLVVWLCGKGEEVKKKKQQQQQQQQAGGRCQDGE
ncbi:uncharacterized protein LOC143280291 [Babylonia areolata]|uniref:uncharacterized protein LOC143280291 n=1 Tax=Babylonia areolata TaxID=304850 RepID=UPI003FD1FF4D